MGRFTNGLGFVVVAFFVACSVPFQPIPTPRPTYEPKQLITRAQKPNIRGVVQEFGKTNRRFFVIATEKPIGDELNRLFVDLMPYTRVYSDTSMSYVEVLTSEIKIGQTVEVLIDLELGMKTSDPPQAYAKEVVIIK